MRIAQPPASVQHLANVRLVIAIGVLQEEEVRRGRDNHATVRERQARRKIQVIREDGDLVGFAVTVRVFENLDAIVPRVAVQHLVRIVHRLDHPQPATLIERERDRLDDVRLAGEELDAELGRRLHELLRLFRRERHLELRRVGPVLVIRNVEAVKVGDAGHLQLLPGAAPRVVHRPDDSAFEEALETRLGPGPLVMAVCGIEDASFALGAQPRPGLAGLTIDALHDHRPIARASWRVWTYGSSQVGNGCSPCMIGWPAGRFRR